MNKLVRLSLAAFTLLATACSSPQYSGDPARDQWRLQGRIGFWMDQQQESGSIDWQQCGSQSSQLRLSGPMGVGGIEISTNAAGAKLHRGEETLNASSAEALAMKAGWPVPVDALRFWVRGKAAPNSPLRGELDASGRLRELEQNGWRIHYLDYSTSHATLPTKIEAENGAQRLRLIIRTWSGADCAK